MGGQNASVVLADADFGRAATAIAYAAMGYAGQKCTATSRIIVEDAAYAKFRDQLAAAVAALGVLDPGQDGTLVGPVISERARDSALAAVAASGGTVLAGGTALDAPGFYLAPTLVELDPRPGRWPPRRCSPRWRRCCGRTVRRRPCGSPTTSGTGWSPPCSPRTLAGRCGWPTSSTRGWSGSTRRPRGWTIHAPFGGAKQSSYGPREQGLAARDFYTETRTVTIVP